MDDNVIGSKELQRGLKYVADAVLNKGETFLVVRNSKPVFRIIPIDNPIRSEVSKRDLMSDLDEISFHSGDSNLSLRIDDLNY